MSASPLFQKRFQDLVDEITEFKRSEIPTSIGISYDIFTKALLYGIVPTTMVLVRIADYFNVSLPFLLGISDDDYFSKLISPIPFSKRLQQLCAKNQLTVYSLSKKTHIDRSNFSFWRRDKYLPSLDNLSILADFFNVTMDYLLGRTDEM